eukprot:10268838-Lingulodinium_polyedra.AAC.1
MWQAVAEDYKEKTGNAAKEAHTNILAALQIARHRHSEGERAKAEAPLTVHSCKLSEEALERWQT